MPIDVDDLLTVERDENTERKSFTPTEAVAIGKMIEEQERPKAEERKRVLSVQNRGDGNLPQPKNPNVRQIVGAAVGMGESSYARARAVVDAA